MTYRALSPTADEIAVVLDAADVDDARAVAVALHLATPADVIVGVHATVSAGAWTVGELTFAAPQPDGEPIRRHAARWAVALSEAMFGQSAAGYCDLSAGPAGWVKPTVSGTRLIAFGVEQFCGHFVSADRTVDAEVVADVAGWAINGGVSLPAVGAAGGIAVLVEERFGFWKVSAADDTVNVTAAAAACDPDAVAECADWVAAQLGGIPRIHRVVGAANGSSHAEVSVRLANDWVAAVPIIVSSGAEVIGEPPSSVGDWVYEGVVPAGFRAVGPAVYADGVIAVHEASGIRVRLLEAL